MCAFRNRRKKKNLDSIFEDVHQKFQDFFLPRLEAATRVENMNARYPLSYPFEGFEATVRVFFSCVSQQLSWAERASKCDKRGEGEKNIGKLLGPPPIPKV